jgi:hypothetical protein
VGGSDVTVTVTCSSSSQTYTVGGAVSGVTASGLVLQNNMGADLPVTTAATSFTFPDHVADGGGYSVTVKSPASGTTCQVASGSGTIHSANVTNVVVTCVPGATGVVQRWESPNTTGVTQTYRRNRQALSIGSSNIQLLAQNEPRIDATKGYLFGLQGGNGLSSNGEAFNLWAPSGATVEADEAPAPVTGGGQTADHITLPAGASLSTAIGAFYSPSESPGPLLAQIWIRPTASAGTLRFSTSNPSAGGANEANVDLSTLAAGAWNHVALHGLTTNALAGTLTMTAASGTPTFDAWGASLSQLCNGGDPGSVQPAPVMYDRSGFTPDPVDVLDLTTPVPQSTATTGFCLSVDAQPYDGLAWNAPLVFKRGLMGWIAAGSTEATAVMYLTGAHADGGAGRLCFFVGAHDGTVVCANAPTGWGPGTKHNVKGCLSASDRNLRLYADDQAIGTPVALPAGASIPDLQGGHLTIGNTRAATPTPGAWFPDPSVPWNGYISKVVACIEGAERATMCR